MRIIDDHQEWLAEIDALKTTRYAFQIADAALNRFIRKPQRLRRSNRGKQVVNIDPADEPGDHVHFSIRGMGAKCQTVEGQLKFLRGYIRIRFQSIADRFLP